MSRPRAKLLSQSNTRVYWFSSLYEMVSDPGWVIEAGRCSRCSSTWVVESIITSLLWQFVYPYLYAQDRIVSTLFTLNGTNTGPKAEVLLPRREVPEYVTQKQTYILAASL